MKAVIRKVSDLLRDGRALLRGLRRFARHLLLYDDLGTQRNLFISPEMWDEFLRPDFVRFVELGRQAGLKTMFHSCGNCPG